MLESNLEFEFKFLIQKARCISFILKLNNWYNKKQRQQQLKRDLTVALPSEKKALIILSLQVSFFGFCFGFGL